MNQNRKMIIFAAIMMAFGQVGIMAQPTLIPVPKPDLDRMHGPTRQSMKHVFTRVDQLRGRSSTSSKELAEAYGYLGLLSHALELEETAIAAYRNATILDPDEPGWSYLVAFLYQHQGMADEAISSFQRVAVLIPNDPFVHIRLGNALIGLNRYEEATVSFERAMVLSPDSVSALFGLGQAAAGLKRHEDAVDFFQRALRSQPEATSIHYQLALAYRALGDVTKARIHMTQRGDGKIQLADPHLKELADVLMLTSIQATLGMAADLNDFDVASFRTFILAKLTTRDGVDEFLRNYAQQMHADPKHNPVVLARIYYTIGILMESKSQVEPAMSHYRKAMSTDPDFSEPALQLANTMIKQHQYDESLQILDGLIAKNDDHAQMRFSRAAAYLNKGQPEYIQRAVADLERAVALAEDRLEYVMRLAVAYGLNGQFDKAIESYLKGLALDQDDTKKADTYQKMSQLAQKAGQPDQALDFLAQSLALDPDRTDRRTRYARALGVAGRYQQAAQQFLEINQREPSLNAIHGAFVSHYLAGDYTQARDLLSREVDAQPNQMVLGLAYARFLVAGPDPALRDAEAGLTLARQLDRKRQSVASMETLAMALALRGQYDEAIDVQQIVIGFVQDDGVKQRLESNAALYREQKPCCQSYAPELYLKVD